MMMSNLVKKIAIKFNRYKRYEVSCENLQVSILFNAHLLYAL